MSDKYSDKDFLIFVIFLSEFYQSLGETLYIYGMAALSWEEILEIGKQHNKTVICEVEKRGRDRYFKVKCNICGDEHYSKSLNFKCCLNCSHNKRRLTNEEFSFKAKSIHGNKYDYSLVGYINNITKIKIICNRCGNIFEQTPLGHLTGRGCRNCSHNKRRLTKEEFSHKAKNLHGNKYDYSLVGYINNITKIKIICNRCENIFEQSPLGHLIGRGCPRCFESKGEIKVLKYLSEKNIRFIKQKTFKSLRDIKPLRYDFYLVGLNLLIEYDGHGHYMPCFGSTPEKKQKNFKDCQRRDKIKNEWAKANNIPLLRIPYWDFDRIEELIEAFILQHTRKKETKQLVLEM